MCPLGCCWAAAKYSVAVGPWICCQPKGWIKAQADRQTGRLGHLSSARLRQRRRLETWRHLTSRTKVLSRSKKAICPGQKIADVPYKEIHPRNTVELSCSVRFYSTPFISSADLDQRSQQICSFVGCDEHGPDGWGCCVHSVSARSLQKMKNPSWLQCYATSTPLETRGWLTIRHHLLPTLHGIRKVWLLLTILEKNRRDSRIHRCRYGSIVPIRYVHS